MELTPGQFRLALIGIFALALGLAGLYLGEVWSAIICIAIGLMMIVSTWGKPKDGNR